LVLSGSHAIQVYRPGWWSKVVQRSVFGLFCLQVSFERVAGSVFDILLEFFDVLREKC